MRGHIRSEVNFFSIPPKQVKLVVVVEVVNCCSSTSALGKVLGHRAAVRPLKAHSTHPFIGPAVTRKTNDSSFHASFEDMLTVAVRGVIKADSLCMLCSEVVYMGVRAIKQLEMRPVSLGETLNIFRFTNHDHPREAALVRISSLPFFVCTDFIRTILNDFTEIDV
jgi:hypothetical protein